MGDGAEEAVPIALDRLEGQPLPREAPPVRRELVRRRRNLALVVRPSRRLPQTTQANDDAGQGQVAKSVRYTHAS